MQPPSPLPPDTLDLLRVHDANLGKKTYRPAGDDWVKVSKPEGGEGGLARGIVFAERKREGLGSEGLVALLVFSYTFLAFGLLFLSYTLRDSMYRRCR